MKNRKILSLILVFVLLMAIVSGCKSRDEGVSESGDSGTSSSSKPSEAPKVSSDKTVEDMLPGMVKYVEEKKAENTDTIGWLQIGQVGVDDVVLCNFEDNMYYHRLNFEKQYDFNGVFYADRRSTFGDGSVEELGVNTCIYGHALTDDKEDKNYNIRFGPLHDFRDPEIAKTIPYIYFTTEKEDLAFEVFAVFPVNINAIKYNRNDLEPAEYRQMVKDEVLKRSIYDYGVEIDDDDKFLTLSTCIYELPNGTATGYPDTYYRFVIMGKLVDSSDPLKTEATFTVNENPYLDLDTPTGK